MRRRASILLLSVLIGLFITLASGSFLAKKREINNSASSAFLVDDITQFNSNLFAMKASFDLDSSLNQVALEILLTRYNYSAAGFDKKGGPSFLLNECFKNSSSDDTQDSSLYCRLDVYNVDPNYSGFEAIKMYLNQSNHYDFDSQNSTMNYYGVPVLIHQSNDTTTNLEKYCSLDASYFFTNSKTKKPFNYTNDPSDNLSLKIRLNNGNCSLALVTPNLTPDLHNSRGDVIKYTMIMIGIAFVQMIGCGLLIWKLEGNSPLYKRTSLGTLSFLIAFDFFIYLIHFTYWTTISSWMAVTFICFFVVAVFIEPVVLYHVFSAFQRRSNTSIVTLLFTIYFCKFFSWRLPLIKLLITGLVISAGCIIFSLVCFPNFIFYIYPFFLVPQIIDNFMARRRYKFNFWLICGLGLPKLFYIAYLSLDPVDLFDKGFTGTLMIYSIVVLTIEMIVLKIQTKLPTFGYKGKNWEEEYNYQCTSEECRLYSNEICSICTEKVSLTPLNGLQIQQPLLEQDESMEYGEIFKTPCRHHFHRECLIEWIRKKLECPNCRQKLPPLPDYLEDDD